MTLTPGHTATVLSSGALWAPLPFLVVERDYDDAAGLAPVLSVLAALPQAVAALASALPQPAAAPPGTIRCLRLEAER